jgi:hypothetical protein
MSLRGGGIFVDQVSKQSNWGPLLLSFPGEGGISVGASIWGIDFLNLPGGGGILAGASICGTVFLNLPRGGRDVIHC